MGLYCGAVATQVIVLNGGSGRELARGDRVRGMAVSQAEVVHRGVVYDLEVDTTHSESLACARIIAAQVR